MASLPGISARNENFHDGQFNNTGRIAMPRGCSTVWKGLHYFPPEPFKFHLCRYLDHTSQGLFMFQISGIRLTKERKVLIFQKEKVLYTFVRYVLFWKRVPYTFVRYLLFFKRVPYTFVRVPSFWKKGTLHFCKVPLFSKKPAYVPLLQDYWNFKMFFTLEKEPPFLALPRFLRAQPKALDI